MPDCPVSGQSGIRVKNIADAGTNPVAEQGDPVLYRNASVPEWDVGCRNADAGGISLDADAQLCNNTHKYVRKVFCT